MTGDPTPPKSKRWFWIATSANVCLTVFTVLCIFAVYMAMAAMASEIEEWPLLVSVAINLPVCVFAIILSRRAVSRAGRITGYTLNSLCLIPCLLVGYYFSWDWAHTTNVRFLIPEGFQGTVTIIYDISNGSPEEKDSHGLIYRVGEDGILLTRGHIVAGPIRPQYFFLKPDGTTQKIENEWYSTIQPTRENLADSKDVGIFFPRTTGGESYVADRKCAYQGKEFDVGSKAYLLAEHEPQTPDLGEYLVAHHACNQ